MDKGGEHEPDPLRTADAANAGKGGFPPRDADQQAQSFAAAPDGWVRDRVRALDDQRRDATVENNALRDRDVTRNRDEDVIAHVWTDDRSQPFCATAFDFHGGKLTATGRWRGISWELAEEGARGTHTYGPERTLSWAAERVVVEARS